MTFGTWLKYVVRPRLMIIKQPICWFKGHWVASCCDSYTPEDGHKSFDSCGRCYKTYEVPVRLDQCEAPPKEK